MDHFTLSFPIILVDSLSVARPDPKWTGPFSNKEYLNGASPKIRLVVAVVTSNNLQYYSVRNWLDFSQNYVEILLIIF